MDRNHWQGGRRERDIESDEFDRELDAALAKFAEVEPRAGLEERVLANLRAQREGTLFRKWRQWTALAAVTAVMIVVALSLVWRPVGSQQAVKTRHQPSKTKDGTERGAEVAMNRERNSPRAAHPVFLKKSAMRSSRPPQPTVAAAAHLNQFPSPQPLSEQEMILVSYVAQFQNQAVLVARARMESLRRDLTEEANDSSLSHESAD